MAEEESHVVTLRNDFYRDSFGKVIFIIVCICIAIGFIAATSVYLHLSKPSPITFPVYADWRVQPDVSLDKPYLTTPEMLQWVSEVIPKSFVYDFNHYNDQLKIASQYFTANGWKVFLNQLNNYVDYTTVVSNKLFVNRARTSAPYVLNPGLLAGRYAWWVQMPIVINFVGYNRSSRQNLTLQLLVVRVSTLNNLAGVAIDNVIVAKSSNSQQPLGTVNQQPLGNR